MGLCEWVGRPRKMAGGLEETPRCEVSASQRDLPSGSYRSRGPISASPTAAICARRPVANGTEELFAQRLVSAHEYHPHCPGAGQRIAGLRRLADASRPGSRLRGSPTVASGRGPHLFHPGKPSWRGGGAGEKMLEEILDVAGGRLGGGLLRAR